MTENCKKCVVKFCPVSGKLAADEVCEDFVPITTKADTIRVKSDKELASFISRLAGCPLNVMEHCPRDECTDDCKAADCWLAWLEKEVDE